MCLAVSKIIPCITRESHSYVTNCKDCGCINPRPGNEQVSIAFATARLAVYVPFGDERRNGESDGPVAKIPLGGDGL